MPCGASDDHCCHLGPAGVCPFVERDTADRPGMWSCSLRRSLGSWPEVYADERYLSVVAPHVRRLVGVDCGDWPEPGDRCATCGVCD